MQRQHDNPSAGDGAPAMPGGARPDNVIPFVPRTRRDEATAAPRRVYRERGWLLGFEDWTQAALPSYRAYWHYDDLCWDEQVKVLLDVACCTDGELARYSLFKGPGGWRVDQRGEIEDLLLTNIEAAVSACELTPEDRLRYGTVEAGFAVLEALSAVERARLQVYAADGESPEAPRHGVRCEGPLHLLNAVLARQDVPLQVIDL